MDELEKEEILYNELAGLLERLTREYSLSYPQVLGTLKIVEAEIIEHYMLHDDEIDEESDED